MMPKEQTPDFIERTQKIVKSYHAEWDVTILINCCVGLLIIPFTEISSKKYSKHLNGDINKSEWGIALKDVKIETDYSIKNITRRLRNSIAHNRFVYLPKSDNAKIIGEIKFTDRANGSRSDNFELTVSVEDFRKFLDKLSQTMLEFKEKSNIRKT